MDNSPSTPESRLLAAEEALLFAQRAIDALTDQATAAQVEARRLAARIDALERRLTRIEDPPEDPAAATQKPPHSAG